MKTKIIAMYLPQFHSIPENDEFWGKGFTDWVTVKKAKSLFEGHNQPKIPLNDNYYDLSQKDAVAWQCKIAREHGIYGFAIYHYWFNNEKNLLTKPAEIIRDNKEIEINYFFTWDNCNWKRSWSNVSGNAWSPIADDEQGLEKRQGPQILIPYILGEEADWEIHYKSLVSHFQDSRYIKIDNKPVFSIINHDENIDKMCAFWNYLAKRDGYNGIYFIFKDGPRVPKYLYRYSYEPHHVTWGSFDLCFRIKGFIKRKLGIAENLEVYNFDTSWDKIITFTRKNKEKTLYYGAFVGYDDTPRRGTKGKIVTGGTSEKFGYYLGKLLNISKSKEKEFIFLTAWNEWGEGAYIEPDSVNGYAYLQAIKQCVLKEGKDIINK